MKRISLFLSLLLPAFAFAAAPQVSDVTFGQITQGSREVTVSYTLTNAPAIVTMDVLSNGVSIGAANIRYLSGDVNCLVQPDPAVRKTIRWQADKSWPDHRITGNDISVKLTAWSADCPPPYLLADLSGTEGIRYYTSTNDLPFGPLTNDLYRTDYLLMRRIDAAGVTWTMGSVTWEGDGNIPHDVTLTNDFYVGVFEVTQGQWKKISESYPSCRYTESDRALHPVENVAYNDMRGAGVYWPAMPDSNSWIGKMCTTLGVPSGTFDLPSEAQWEFAARANHFGDRNGDGTWYAATNQLQIAVYSENPITWQISNTTTNKGAYTAAVGSLKPNDWGLYDTQGNVWEWCLDWKWTDGRLATNYFGEVCTVQNAKNHVVRGGCFYNGVGDTRLSRRGGADYDNRSQGSRGFRLVYVMR